MPLLIPSNESDKREQALKAAQSRMSRSRPPRILRIEEAHDKVAFLQHVNQIRGAKAAPEALKILELLHTIASDTLKAYNDMKPERRVKQSKVLDILDCEGSRDLFLKMGFRKRTIEMQELYTIASFAGRPQIAVALLSTAISVLETEIVRLREEEQARKDRAERERLAPLGAKEQALRNIEDDRRRVRNREKAPVESRFTTSSVPLGTK